MRILMLNFILFVSSIANAEPDPVPFFVKALKSSAQNVEVRVVPGSFGYRFAQVLVNGTAVLDDKIGDNATRMYWLEVERDGKTYQCDGSITRPAWVQNDHTRLVGVVCDQDPEKSVLVSGREITLDN